MCGGDGGGGDGGGTAGSFSGFGESTSGMYGGEPGGFTGSADPSGMGPGGAFAGSGLSYGDISSAPAASEGIDYGANYAGPVSISPSSGIDGMGPQGVFSGSGLSYGGVTSTPASSNPNFGASAYDSPAAYLASEVNVNWANAVNSAASAAIEGLLGITAPPGAGMMASFALSQAPDQSSYGNKGTGAFTGFAGDNTGGPGYDGSTVPFQGGASQQGYAGGSSGAGGGVDVDTEISKLLSQISGSTDPYLAQQKQLLADLENSGLTPEEIADFEEQYLNELNALVADFDIKKERVGARQIAELTSRNMLTTTTGERSLAETQQTFSDVLMGAQADLLQSKESAMQDYDTAKKDIARARYQISSGMTQAQINTSLQAATALQDYYLSKGGARAQSALNSALMTQANEKAKYDQRSELWGTVAGIGGSLLKSGISSLF